MKPYITTEIVPKLAKPMTRQAYNAHRGWALPEDEDGQATGFLVESKSGPTNHPSHTGHTTWIAEEAFLRTHVPTNAPEGSSEKLQRMYAEKAQLQALCEELEKELADEESLREKGKTAVYLLATQHTLLQTYLNILDIQIAEEQDRAESPPEQEPEPSIGEGVGNIVNHTNSY